MNGSSSSLLSRLFSRADRGRMVCVVRGTGSERRSDEIGHPINLMSAMMHFRLPLFLLTAGLLLSRAAGEPSVSEASPVKPRARVIIDNDFGGDPDGLFQLAHHLLSPSVEVRGIIGSHHHPAGFYGYPGTADHAVAMVDRLLGVMNLRGEVPVFKGANQGLAGTDTPLPSPAVEFIVREAMRDDVKTPLYLVCGAGLTDTASAWLTEPKIAEKLRLIWIGGPEYPGTPAPPGAAGVEYNLSIDRKAAQVIFNRSDLLLWQVPRSTYRQALVSHAELKLRMQPEKNSLGQFLLGRLDELLVRAKGTLGEAYVLGDNPLVVLTALQSSWEVDPSSCRYVEMPVPRIDDHGRYAGNDAEGQRKLRVYTTLDTRLMFEDFYAKVAASHLRIPPER